MFQTQKDKKEKEFRKSLKKMDRGQLEELTVHLNKTLTETNLDFMKHMNKMIVERGESNQKQYDMLMKAFNDTLDLIESALEKGSPELALEVIQGWNKNFKSLSEEV